MTARLDKLVGENVLQFNRLAEAEREQGLKLTVVRLAVVRVSQWLWSTLWIGFIYYLK